MQHHIMLVKPVRRAKGKTRLIRRIGSQKGLGQGRAFDWQTGQAIDNHHLAIKAVLAQRLGTGNAGMAATHNHHTHRIAPLPSCQTD